MKDRPLHEPVMLNEAMGALNPIKGGIYLDATFGCGGYSRAILERADCQVFAIDKDPTAVERGRNMQAQFNGRLFLAEGCFSKMKALIYRQFSKKTKLAGATFDLGLCSTQIDEGQRGFSFQKDGPLDMRMSQSGESAADILMRISEKDLAQILWDYGEEKASRRIAKAICNARSKNRISRTVQLATIIHSVMPTKNPTRLTLQPAVFRH